MTDTAGRGSGAPTAGQAGFRPDIEGLRAIAVGAVLLYHAGLPWLPGGFAGVDIFFVISGFLITSLMLREIDRNGRLQLNAFWARRVRRLLPASAVVLAFSALVTIVCLPASDRKTFGGDIIAAAGYIVNWRLGMREVNYLANDVGASPVQHFWSLAVEEQFYVIWPLALAAVTAWVGVRHRRAVFFAVVLVATLASFAWAVHYSANWPGLAFFVTTTRLWELGVGALLAIAAPHLIPRMPQVVRGSLGLVGLALLMVVFVAYEPSWAWPSTGTLLPVLGAAALILAGGESGRGLGVTGLLGLRPAVWIGALSYSLYLWHWPMLVAAEAIWADDLRLRYRLLVIAVSVLPAWLSYRFIENPIRRSASWGTPDRALTYGLGTTLLSGAVGLTVIVSFSWVATVPLAEPSQAEGAAVLLEPAEETGQPDWATVDSVDALRPSPLETDLPSIYDTRECMPDALEARNMACEFGDLSSERTVVLVGDSKAAQWFTPMEQIATNTGWRLVLIAKSNCEFADVIRPGLAGQSVPACDEWSQWALDEIEDLAPDVVVTVTYRGTALRTDQEVGDTPTQDSMVAGLVSHWDAVIEAGAVLVPLLDTPGKPGGRVPECVQENLDNLTACSYQLVDGVRRSGAPAQRAAAQQVPEARVVDLTDGVCPDGVTCPPVIGNVLLYRAGTHLTDTYASTLEPLLSDRLAAATDGLLGERLPS